MISGFFYTERPGGLNSGLRCAMHGIVDLMNIAAELTSKMGYVPVQQNKMNGNVAKYKKIALVHLTSLLESLWEISWVRFLFFSTFGIHRAAPAVFFFGFQDRIF